MPSGINALCWLAQFYARRDIKNAEHYKSMADKVRDSFRKLFWNPASSGLFKRLHFA